MTKGAYNLSAYVPGVGSDTASLSAELVRRGTYTFDEARGALTVTPDDGSVDSPMEIGSFSALPIGDRPFAEGIFESRAEADMPCIEVVCSEVMAEIQNPENELAYFVLPSQLNGAEFPSHQRIVPDIGDYKFDPTGGPRAQLAVHPAAGQFILDNAATTARELGINAVDRLVQKANAALDEAGFSSQKSHFNLVNGYLRIPEPQGEEAAEQMIALFRANAHTLRPLLMADVPACGLRPNLREFSAERHRVNLIYASALPINAYVNGIGVVPKSFGDAEQKRYQARVAESLLATQYFGALQTASLRSTPEAKRKVFLLPLGGGAFKNSWETIARAMSLAVEMLDSTQRELLEVKALAFEHGKAGASDETPASVRLTELLGRHRKLAAAGEEGPDRKSVV